MRTAAGAARHTAGRGRHGLQPLGADGYPTVVAQAVGPFIHLHERPVDLGERGGDGASGGCGADSLDGLGGALTDALPERQVGSCLRGFRQFGKLLGELAPTCLQKDLNLFQSHLSMLVRSGGSLVPSKDLSRIPPLRSTWHYSIRHSDRVRNTGAHWRSEE